MPTAMKEVSEKLTAVDDLAPWSSPASAIAPPFGGDAGEIGVAQRVARPVDAGPFSVPDAEDAIDHCAGKARQVLGAPDRGRRKVLVEAGAEDDVVLLEDCAGAPEFNVEAAERRAAIAGNIAAGVEAGRLVAQALLDRQAHQRLHAGHIEPALGGRPAVFEAGLRPGERNGHIVSLMDGSPLSALSAPRLRHARQERSASSNSGKYRRMTSMSNAARTNSFCS